MNMALDTLKPGANRGEFRPEQARRLVEWIAAEPDKPVVVFTHHPPFEVTVGPDRFHFATAESMTLLRDALRRGGRVIAVLSGHVHRAAAGRIGTIPASVVPCIATTLRKGEYPPLMKTRPVYHLHRFDPAWGFITESRVVRSRAEERGSAPIAAASLTDG
jgi:3',5'-cyclic-AMP phosphodiesterase